MLHHRTRVAIFFVIVLTMAFFPAVGAAAAYGATAGGAPAYGATAGGATAGGATIADVPREVKELSVEMEKHKRYAETTVRSAKSELHHNKKLLSHLKHTYNRARQSVDAMLRYLEQVVATRGAINLQQLYGLRTQSEDAFAAFAAQAAMLEAQRPGRSVDGVPSGESSRAESFPAAYWNRLAEEATRNFQNTKDMMDDAQIMEIVTVLRGYRWDRWDDVSSWKESARISGTPKV